MTPRAPQARQTELTKLIEQSSLFPIVSLKGITEKPLVLGSMENLSGVYR